MKSLGLASFVMCVVGAVACSSSNNNGSSPDGGAPSLPDGGGGGVDAATCGKLPPTGASTIVAPSTNGSVEIGANVAFTLDKAGRPVFAYVTADTANKTYELDVMTWDDCAGAWRAAVKVDDKVDVDRTRSLSLSVDSSDGRIAIGYAKTVHLVSPPKVNDTVAAYVAISSDNGKTFTTAKASDHGAEHGQGEGDINDVDHVRVALGGGKTFVAYNQTYQACSSGATPDCANGTVLATANGAAFTYEMVKNGNAKYGGNAPTRGFGLGLAVDSDNVPGLVVHIEPDTGYNTILMYWRPGQTNGGQVTDSNGVQNDDGDVSLAYDGKKPRMAYTLQRGAIGATKDYDLSFSLSDDGQGWGAQLPLPRPEHITYSQNIVASGGKTWVFAGGPHVFTSSDNATFQVDSIGLAQTSGSVTGAVDASGKFWVGIEGITPPGESNGGIVLYRQP